MTNQEARQHIINTASEGSYPIIMKCSRSFYNKALKHPYLKFVSFCKDFPDYSKYTAYAKNIKGKKVYVVYGDGVYLGKIKRDSRLTSAGGTVLTYGSTNNQLGSITHVGE